MNGVLKVLGGFFGFAVGCGFLLWFYAICVGLFVTVTSHLPEMVQSVWAVAAPPRPGGTVWLWALRGFSLLFLALMEFFLFVFATWPLLVLLDEPTRPLRDTILGRLEAVVHALSLRFARVRSRFLVRGGLAIPLRRRPVALPPPVLGAIQGGAGGAVLGAFVWFPDLRTSGPLWITFLPMVIGGFVGAWIGVVSHPGTSQARAAPGSPAGELLYTAILARRNGDLSAARRMGEKSLSQFRNTGKKWQIAHGATMLGGWALSDGDEAQGIALAMEGLKLARELADRQAIAGSLENMGRVAARAGRTARAVRLFGAAATAEELCGSSRCGSEQEAVDTALAAVRASLEEPDFAAAWAEGRAMTLSQAIAYALEEAGADISPA